MMAAPAFLEKFKSKITTVDRSGAFGMPVSVASSTKRSTVNLAPSEHIIRQQQPTAMESSSAEIISNKPTLEDLKDLVRQVTQPIEPFKTSSITIPKIPSARKQSTEACENLLADLESFLDEEQMEEEFEINSDVSDGAEELLEAALELLQPIKQTAPAPPNKLVENQSRLELLRHSSTHQQAAPAAKVDIKSSSDPFSNIPEWNATNIKTLNDIPDWTDNNKQLSSSLSLVAEKDDYDKLDDSRSKSRIETIVTRKSLSSSSKSRKPPKTGGEWIDPSPKVKRYSVPRAVEQDDAVVLPPQLPPMLSHDAIHLYHNHHQHHHQPVQVDALWQDINQRSLYYQFQQQQNNSAQLQPHQLLPPIIPTAALFQQQQQRQFESMQTQSQQHNNNNINNAASEISESSYSRRNQQDQTVFNYRMYGLEDYQRQLRSYYPQLNRLGGLGPDLDSETYLQRLQKSMKIKEYATKVREINLQRINSSSMSLLRKKPSELKERELAAWRRQRMMEYSNSIPKPPISIPKPSLKNNQGISASAPELSSTGAARQVLANGDQVPSFMSELEKKYHESLSKVDEIRRQHRRMVLSAE